MGLELSIFWVGPVEDMGIITFLGPGQGIAQAIPGHIGPSAHAPVPSKKIL
jgi:hypothetical protein